MGLVAAVILYAAAVTSPALVTHEAFAHAEEGHHSDASTLVRLIHAHHQAHDTHDHFLLPDAASSRNGGISHVDVVAQPFTVVSLRTWSTDLTHLMRPATSPSTLRSPLSISTVLRI